MSYKATVDVVIALNTFKISSFRRQGKLRFLLSLSQLVPPNIHNINVFILRISEKIRRQCMHSL